MVIALLSIISGLIILLVGGEVLIKGAILIAKNLNISKILVSSVIVGFGTSMPEMTVSIEAIFMNAPEIAIGNVIGSNIANILFILGIAATISPFNSTRPIPKRDILMMIFSTIMLCVFAIFGVINFIQGIIMLLILLSYITYSYKQDKKHFTVSEVEKSLPNMGILQNLNLSLSILLAISGMVLLILGSSIFLNAAIEIAQIFNIAQEIIGLGIVAIGSCLPELTTATIASIRKQGNIVIASIVGSNIFNILSIVGVATIIRDIYIPPHILKFDLWIFLIATMILCWILLRNIKFSRKIGIAFLGSYILYFYLLFYYS